MKTEVMEKLIKSGCPTCRGRLIKYGIQTWTKRGESDKIQRWQRCKCVKCKRLTYFYIETITASRRGRNGKPSPVCPASLTKFIGEGGNDKRRR